MLRYIPALFAIILLSFSAQAQSAKTIQMMAYAHQKCLDSGVDMLGCSYNYYLQMDSMLNVVYNKLRKGMNETQKATLKTEQLNWLKKRDKYFKEDVKKVKHDLGKDGLGGADVEMVTYDDYAMFIEERVLELIKRFK